MNSRLCFGNPLKKSIHTLFALCFLCYCDITGTSWIGLNRIVVNKMPNFVRHVLCTPQKNSEKRRCTETDLCSEKVRHDWRRTVQSPLYYCGKRGGVEVFGARWHIKSAIVSRLHWNMDVISPNKPAQLRHIRNALQRPGKSYLPLSPSLLMQRETLSKHHTNIQTEREREVG